MWKGIGRITANERISRALRYDLSEISIKYPELSVVFKNERPMEISGTFRIRDNEGTEQGNWNIRIPIPQRYPFEFPVLYETSQKIFPSPDNHVSKNGEVCVELNIIAELIASKGIRLFDFVNNYVFKFFCWILLKENGEENMDAWAHEEAGIKQFFQEIFETTDAKFIINSVNLIVTNKLPGRNAPCFCMNGRKYKHCHESNILKLKKYTHAILKKYAVVFSEQTN